MTTICQLFVLCLLGIVRNAASCQLFALFDRTSLLSGLDKVCYSEFRWKSVENSSEETQESIMNVS